MRHASGCERYSVFIITLPCFQNKFLETKQILLLLFEVLIVLRKELPLQLLKQESRKNVKISLPLFPPVQGKDFDISSF